MTKNKIIGQIRIRAERDLTISGEACRAIFRICSSIYTNPKAKIEDAFPLPWSKVGAWCGCQDEAAYARIEELVKANYLRFDRLRGCPPIRYFFLIPNYLNNPVIDCLKSPVINSPVTQVINSPKKQVINSPKKQVINSPKNPAHHISNSFQEEKIKGKRGDFNGSLRSKETVGVAKAAAPTLTDAKRAEHVQALSQLRHEIAGDGKTKTKTKTKAGTLLNKK
jgi:hypothetical protein